MFLYSEYKKKNAENRRPEFSHITGNFDGNDLFYYSILKPSPVYIIYGTQTIKLMRQLLAGISLFAICLSFTACGGKESAASIAKKWCDLNGKVHKAAEGAEKEAAEAARKKFENDMEAKYKDDKAFMEEVGKEVEKCEDASEGR